MTQTGFQRISDFPDIPSSSDNTMLLNMIRCLTMIILGVVPFIFVSNSIGRASKGIARAAEIRIDSVMTLMPMGFITVSLIYTLIIFMSLKDLDFNNMEIAFKALSSSFIVAFGSASAAKAVGMVTEFCVEVRAHIKRFETYFMIMLMFAEVVGIFSLLLGIFNLQKKKVDWPRSSDCYSIKNDILHLKYYINKDMQCEMGFGIGCKYVYNPYKRLFCVYF